MNGVLLLAHGSRAPESVQTMEELADKVRKALPERLIQVAYMQFHEINIEKGILLLMDKGVTDVTVIPYFLFDGIHIREDIPNELAAFKSAHPEVKLTLGRTLGADKRLAEIVIERIGERD